LWATPCEGLTLGATYQSLRFDWNYDIDSSLIGPLQKVGLLPKMFNGTLPVQFDVKLYVASAEYRAENLLLSAEYSRWIGDIDSASKLAMVHAVNERYYAMASYRIAPWFTPGVYYSVYYPDVHQTRGRQNYQHDFAVTARYDINRFWLVKLEGHVMDGTAVLDPALNGVANVSSLPKDWGLFLVKTTAYF
jgi:predicted porin